MQNTANGASPQTRTIEQSIEQAHKLVDETYQALGALRSSLTGYLPETEATPFVTSGIQGSADYLATRLQSLVMDLHSTGALVATPNLASLANGQAIGGDYARQNLAAGRLG